MVSNRDETFVSLFLLQHSHTHTHTQISITLSTSTYFFTPAREMQQATFPREVQHAIFAWPDNHSMILSNFFHVRAFLGADEELLPAAAADFSEAAPASILRCTGFKKRQLHGNFLNC